ncbi:MAG: hypothetical protein [Microviridae sp.]|nr:MAG: hypothetical protein [Microviridae sp.]
MTALTTIRMTFRLSIVSILPNKQKPLEILYNVPRIYKLKLRNIRKKLDLIFRISLHRRRLHSQHHQYPKTKNITNTKRPDTRAFFV